MYEYMSMYMHVWFCVCGDDGGVYACTKNMYSVLCGVLSLTGHHRLV